jgi:nitronate monooxygenase
VTGIVGALERPVVVAPMAGGASTPDLVVAAADAGALGFLAAGYKTAAQVEAQVADVRARTSGPFGVNLFVPGAPTRFRDELSAYVRELAPEAAVRGVDVGDPVWDDDDWAAKTDLLVDLCPDVASFTFGRPQPTLVTALHRRGTVVMVTVTDVAEAEQAISSGADVLCAQGIQAGAHRGSFSDDDRTDAGMTTLDLVAALRRRTGLPVVAAGGIALPGDVAAALGAGADAVQAGTAFLRSDESGASELHKQALVDSGYTGTALTRAFTGRRARGLVNRFMEHHPDAPRAYPEIHHLTRPLRSAAVHQGDPHGVNLWAGTGYRHARTGPAAAIVEWLCSAGT